MARSSWAWAWANEQQQGPKKSMKKTHDITTMTPANRNTKHKQ